MFEKNLERSWGFHPRHLAPPNAITPGKVITALSHCTGAVRGDRLCVPSFKACVPFILC